MVHQESFAFPKKFGPSLVSVAVTSVTTSICSEQSTYGWYLEGKCTEKRLPLFEKLVTKAVTLWKTSPTVTKVTSRLPLFLRLNLLN
jgi:hypothetical protein